MAKLIDDNFNLWSLFLDEQDIEYAQGNKVSYRSIVYPNYLQVKNYIATQLHSRRALSIDALTQRHLIKVRLLIHDAEFRQFILANNLLLELALSYEFAALNLFKYLELEEFLSYKDVALSDVTLRGQPNLSSIVLIGRLHKNFGLFLLKNDAIKHSLLKSKDFQTYMKYLAEVHESCAMYILMEDRSLLSELELDTLLAIFKKQKSTVAIFSQDKTCVDYLNLLFIKNNQDPVESLRIFYERSVLNSP